MDGSGEDGIRALKAAIAGHFGSQVKTARAVGVTPQAVSEVVRRGKRVPAEWCLKLERASGGLLTAQALRPDLYPADQKQTGGPVDDVWMTAQAPRKDKP